MRQTNASSSAARGPFVQAVSTKGVACSNHSRHNTITKCFFFSFLENSQLTNSFPAPWPLLAQLPRLLDASTEVKKPRN